MPVCRYCCAQHSLPNHRVHQRSPLPRPPARRSCGPHWLRHRTQQMMRPLMGFPRRLICRRLPCSLGTGPTLLLQKSGRRTRHPPRRKMLPGGACRPSPADTANGRQMREERRHPHPRPARGRPTFCAENRRRGRGRRLRQHRAARQRVICSGTMAKMTNCIRLLWPSRHKCRQGAGAALTTQPHRKVKLGRRVTPRHRVTPPRRATPGRKATPDRKSPADQRLAATFQSGAA